jgi:hypothetical protein
MSFLEILGKTDLGPVGVALIEKISAAGGALTKPLRTIADAWAEVEANKIKTVGEIRIQAAEQRAIERLLCETIKEHKNLGSIYGKLYALVENDPEIKPETIREIDDDWITFYSARARRVSDEDMQHVWARIFKEEAKKPGSFSRRAVAFVETLEKNEAHLFNELCRFVVFDDRETRPVLAVPSKQQAGSEIFHRIFLESGINLSAMARLDSMGLVKFTTPWLTESGRFYDSRAIRVRYCGDERRFQLPEMQKQPGHYHFYYGSAGFTPLGEELFKLATPAKVPGFFDYLESAWASRGILRIPEGWDFERDGILPTEGNAPGSSPPSLGNYTVLTKKLDVSTR